MNLFRRRRQRPPTEVSRIKHPKPPHSAERKKSPTEVREQSRRKGRKVDRLPAWAGEAEFMRPPLLDLDVRLAVAALRLRSIGRQPSLVPLQDQGAEPPLVHP